VTVAIGLVGLGYWGPNLARAIDAAPQADLAAICDTDASLLERAARKHPRARTFSTAEAMLAEADVEAVAIATPAATHFGLARAALKAGKNVLVEKPMAGTAAEAEELIALAEAKERVLMPAHVFLYNAAVRKVRQYIESGELGEVYYVYSQRLNLGQVRRDVNALWNFAPHDVSILAYWLGAVPERLTAAGFSYLQPGIEDVVFMTMQYPGGVGANVHISWLDPQKVRLMTVVGSDKMVIYDDTSPDERIRLIDKGVTRRLVERADDAAPSLGTYETFAEFQLLLRAGDVLIPKIDFEEPLQLEIGDFVGAIRDRRQPFSSARGGLEVVRVLEAAQRSLDQGGAPVTV